MLSPLAPREKMFQVTSLLSQCHELPNLTRSQSNTPSISPEKPQMPVCTAGIQIAPRLTRMMKEHAIRKYNGEETIMHMPTRLWREDEGQGLVEYTLIVLLVSLVFWMGVKDTQVGARMADGWSRVTSCVAAPFSCTP